MQRVFISDLHLEDPAAPTFLRFQELLAVEAAKADQIYILGDLVEMWVGDDDDSPTARAVIEALQLTSRSCEVLLMHGNRDFLFGTAFASESGVRLLDEPHQIDTNLFVAHGDAWCTDDVDYQNVRTLFRSDAWQADILAKSLAERKALGQMLRAQSQNENANKAANIMDVNHEAIEQAFIASGCRTLIHGHTHRPGLHQHQNGQRWVLGAWERCGWLLRQSGTQLQLECFSLARRYGT